MTGLSKMCCRVNKIWEWKNHQGQLGYFSRDLGEALGAEPLEFGINTMEETTP